MDTNIKLQDEVRNIREYLENLQQGRRRTLLVMRWPKVFLFIFIVFLGGAGFGYFGSGLAPYYASRDACLLKNLTDAQTNLVAQGIYEACKKYN